VRVVVLFPGALGDLCLLAPALAALVGDGPRLTLCVQRSLEPVVALLLPAAEIGPPVDGAFFATLFADEPDPELLRWLRDAGRVHAWLGRGDPDGRVDATVRAAGITVAWHAVPRDEDARHVGDDYAAALGLDGPVPPIHARAPVVPDLVLPWNVPEARRVLLHPGAGGRHKRWDARGFGLVIEGLRAADRQPVVLLGPAEHGEATTWHQTDVAVVEEIDLVAAAALIASAPVWIGNDSGMSHVAGALGRRGVVLFGATRAARWCPRGGAMVNIATSGRTLDEIAREVCARALTVA
jgi:heptosyltransferase-3